MKRQTLDEYLDQELNAAARDAVERELAAQTTVARQLTRLQAERASRAAVYASYAPSAQEAQALASRIMDACQESHAAPIGRIGFWLRRGSAVAAAIALLIGAFAMGRVTAPSATVDATPAKTLYSVVYMDSSNDIQVREFASVDERTSFIRDLEMRQNNVVAVADLTKPGAM